jgi:hypothetical protein
MVGAVVGMVGGWLPNGHKVSKYPDKLNSFSVPGCNAQFAQPFAPVPVLI